MDEPRTSSLRVLSHLKYPNVLERKEKRKNNKLKKRMFILLADFHELQCPQSESVIVFDAYV